MGLMDSLKKATGFGLNSSELCDRAYENTVLLVPANYFEAVDFFDAGTKKTEAVGKGIAR